LAEHKVEGRISECGFVSGIEEEQTMTHLVFRDRLLHYVDHGSHPEPALKIVHSTQRG
jgi:hypothetical protein